MTRSALSHWIVSLLIAAAVAPAGAQNSTFRITQIYSNLDGSVQFVELTESTGRDGQHRLAGLTLTSTHGGVVKRFTFPSDLPTDATANRSITVATSGFFINGPPSGWHVPDFESLPARFLPTNGGSVDFVGVDRVSYASLPTDGLHALDRDGQRQEAAVHFRPL